ncbi:T9SS type A sorting domain-containing protein [Flagellimonas myxillae]|uniref:T9SS type A sorting domain-containing protein n=1 Tax=Flagellimonas myxillae TaxID=2942214 RepID=UPI00201F53E4|nr:T9SS type A sorting domain-containing protein [Muricauda myxillae]MCL6266326.1 T9SS type A sorting domain-containing protein [Muricauda myxillae]
MNKQPLLVALFLSIVFLNGQDLKYVQEDFIKLNFLIDDGEGFGSSMAYEDNILVIGAPDHFVDGLGDKGAVYVFERIGAEWVKTAKLIGTNDLHEKFGSDVAISNGTIVVGAYWDDENGNSSGSAFVFDKQGDSWVLNTKLIPADNTLADFFGRSVTIVDDIIAVGAQLDDDTGNNSGSVYIYTRDNGVWTESEKLTASDGVESLGFGSSLDMEGNTLVVGSRGNPYVYQLENGNWIETKLDLYSSITRDLDGRVVSISNNTIAYGVNTEVSIVEKVGDDWTAPVVIKPSNTQYVENFGLSLDLEGDLLVVGASLSNFLGLYSGSVHIFSKEGNVWEEKEILFADNGGLGDQFGSSVVITANAIIGGAPGEDSPDEDHPDVDDNVPSLHSGAAYSFMIDTDGDGVVDSVEDADGTDKTDTCDFLWNNQKAIPDDDWMVMDCDLDGLANIAEYNNGMNPVDADTDGDGVDDLADIENPLDPCLPIQPENYTGYNANNPIWAAADCDGDGVLNGEEFENGSNPYVSPISLDVVVNSSTCNGADDASIRVDITGGDPPFTYHLLDENGNTLVSVTDNLFENLPPGNYSVRVIDDVGDTNESNIIAISEPDEISIITTVSEIGCWGSNYGIIEVTASGGVAPYQYGINGNELTNANLFSGLPSGSYDVRVVDSNGCETNASVEVNLPPALELVEIATTNVSCMGLNDGSLTITGIGGQTPHRYSLDGVTYVEEKTFSGLTAGLYIVFLKDQTDCIQIETQILIEEPTDTDFDNDGIGDSCDEDIDGDGVLNENDLCPDTVLGATVNVDGCEIFSLPPNNFTIQTVGESCRDSNNGSIKIEALEAYNYTAVLTGGAINQTLAFTTAVDFDGLSAGVYEVCITVEEEPAYSKCFMLNISEPEPLSVFAQVNLTGKTVTLNLNGGKYYNIQLNGTTYQTGDNAITLPLTQPENALIVKTGKECQGVYEDLISISNEMVVFPNPITKGDITINLSGIPDGKIQTALFTNDGKLVRQKEHEAANSIVKINMDGLPSGVYSLHIKNGIKSYSRKIIKK